jgi:hypothetical protein
LRTELLLVLVLIALLVLTLGRAKWGLPRRLLLVLLVLLCAGLGCRIEAVVVQQPFELFRLPALQIVCPTLMLLLLLLLLLLLCLLDHVVCTVSVVDILLRYRKTILRTGTHRDAQAKGEVAADLGVTTAVPSCSGAVWMHTSSCSSSPFGTSSLP